MAVNMHNNSISSLTDLIASGNISAASVVATSNIYCNTTAISTFNKKHLVRYYISRKLQFCLKEIKTLFTQTRIPVGFFDGLVYILTVLSIIETAAQCSISSAGNILTSGTITSTRLIQGCSLTIIRNSPSSALVPTVASVHLNNFGGYAHID